MLRRHCNNVHAEELVRTLVAVLIGGARIPSPFSLFVSFPIISPTAGKAGQDIPTIFHGDMSGEC